MFANGAFEHIRQSSSGGLEVVFRGCDLDAQGFADFRRGKIVTQTPVQHTKIVALTLAV